MLFIVTEISIQGYKENVEKTNISGLKAKTLVGVPALCFINYETLEKLS